AFERDFQGFHQWESFVVEEGGAQSMTHLAGPRRDYLNRRPPAGSTTFPVGTVIVKELEAAATLVDRQIFAMVKRGGEYNSAGAAGWEWFELKNRANGSVQIVWRGVGPPSGERYGGDPTGGCNPCHGLYRPNDFVRSAALDLKRLAGM